MRYEAAALRLRQIVVILAQHIEHQVQIVQSLQQHRRIRVVESQRDPLQHQVQIAYQRFTVGRQIVQKHVNGLQMVTEVRMEHVRHQALVDVGRLHLVAQ